MRKRALVLPEFIDYIYNDLSDFMNKGICYIIGAAPFCLPQNFEKRENDIIICADGGLSTLEKFSVLPDVCVGDFDSLGYVPEKENTVVFNKEKDETDTFLAYLEGKKLGFDKFVIFGGIGGNRPEHTFANLQLLSYMAKRGERGFLIGEDTIITAISDGKIKFPETNRGYISVFCFGDNADGVNIKGLKYECTDGSLKNDFPLGVSNEFTGKQAEISVKKGVLTILWHENAENLNLFL